MPQLARRRDPEAHHQETWHVYYGDVRVGTISERAGVPVDEDKWGWNCGFYPGTEPGEYLSALRRPSIRHAPSSPRCGRSSCRSGPTRTSPRFGDTAP